MAIKTYTKGVKTQLSTNFKSTEFDCHGSGCCSSTQVDEELVKILQRIRDHFGKPLNISSGYRCEVHNKKIGGATGSRHKKGQAADIYISGIAPAEIAKYAESIGVLGIGLYETDADGYFVHVDTRTTKSFWYGQSEKPRDTFGGNQPVAKPDTSKVDTNAIDAKVMWDYFKNKGLNDYGVAGLMGNLNAESALRPCNLQQTYEKSLGMSDAEYTAAVDAGTYDNFINDKAGYGLAQWTYWSLKKEMLEYFKNKGKSIGDGETQMEFLCYQLSKSYKAVWNILLSATSVREASDAVLLKFERPADQSVAVQEKRAAYGQTYYDKFAKQATPSAPVETPKGGSSKMKYNEKNKPMVCMMTQSTCYKGTSKMNVKGVLWHSTGANNPTLKRYVQPDDNAKNRDELIAIIGKNAYNNDWNHISRQAGLNCWIGKLADGSVTTIQTMPWDYKPWGCGSGKNGSCNNGWIQFEICEDGLTDPNYFKLAYEEACQITAYLCAMYDIDPLGTVDYNGVKVPTILCHYDSYKLGLGSNHGDIDHWFPKHGKSMATARADVAALMQDSNLGSITPPAEEKPAEDKKVYYRVRKTWEDASSQKGAYTVLENAKKRVDELGAGYYVFDEAGKIVYPPVEAKTVNGLKKGDAAQLIAGATYTSGGGIPAWVLESKVYVREIRSNGDVVFSTLQTGAVTGTTEGKNLVAWVEKVEAPKPAPNAEITKGAKVKLLPGATYANGGKIPGWVFDATLYAREIRRNGDIVISTQETGAITGVVNKKNLQLAELTPKYSVQVSAAVVNIRQEPSTSSAIVGQTQAGEIHEIYEVQGYWGRTKSGWIYMTYTKKV